MISATSCYTTGTSCYTTGTTSVTSVSGTTTSDGFYTYDCGVPVEDTSTYRNIKKDKINVIHSFDTKRGIPTDLKKGEYTFYDPDRHVEMILTVKGEPKIEWEY